MVEREKTARIFAFCHLKGYKNLVQGFRRRREREQN